MWLFALPALLVNVCIILIPGLLTLAAAFFFWDGVGTPVWAGLANFQGLFEDPVFWSALTNNFIWTAIFLIIPMCLAVVMAAALTTTGLVGWLNGLGFSISDPLADPDRSLYAVAAVDIWHWWGFLAVVFFAAMRQISVDQIEAARLDGAGFFALLRYVLLPGIQPTLVLMMILTVIWSFQVFEFIYIVTQGGPAYGSEVLATLAYRNAFFNGDVGKATAAACVMSLFGLCATSVYIWLQSRDGAHAA